MIDTIAMKQTSYDLDARRLTDLGATAKPWRRNPTWVINSEKGSVSPAITISQTPDGVFHIYTECSIPRLLFGHNAGLPSTEVEVRNGVEAMATYVGNVLGIGFDGETAGISKIHLTRDYYLGDAANRAVWALFDRRLRHFAKRVVTADDGEAITLYFNYRSKRRNCVICIYPKYADVLSKNGPAEALEAAQGNLRIEYRANTLIGVRALCRRFSVENTDELLTCELNDRVFRCLEAELSFPECVDGQESPLSKLLGTYRPTKAQRLFGFLELRKLKGDAELTKTEKERRSFNTARRECERAGVWLDLRHNPEE